MTNKLGVKSVCFCRGCIYVCISVCVSVIVVGVILKSSVLPPCVENMGTMQNPFIIIIIISMLLLHCIVLYFSGDNTERRGMLPDQQQSAHQVEGQLLHTVHTSAARY